MDYFRLNARLRKLLSPLKDSPLLVQAMMLLVQSESESQAAAASATETQVTTRKIRSETGQVELEAETAEDTTRVQLLAESVPKLKWDADVLTQTEFRYLSGVSSPLQTQIGNRELLSNKDTDPLLGNSDTKYPSQKAVKSYVDGTFQPLSGKGQANGYAPLNSSGKIDAQYLTLTGEEYKGVWNASTNTPSLTNGTGTAGQYYRVTVAGTVDFGAGNIAFVVGDDVYYDGAIWARRPSAGNLVVSVNGKDGVVSLGKSDIGLGNVDNTADADKPISTAVANALTGKLGTTLASAKLWVGDAGGVAVARSLSLSATPGAFGLSATGVLTLPNASGSNRGLLSASDWTSFANKQAALGYTPEDVSNKSTNASLGTSDTAYPSQKAVKSYVDNGLGTKQATITGAASSITENNLTSNRVLVSSSTGKVAVSAVTATELGYLDGVTSSVQMQLNGKQSALAYTPEDVSNKSTNASLGNSDTAYPSQKAVKTYVDNGLGTKQATITGAASSITGNNLTANRVLVSSSTGKVAVSAVTATELSYLDGVTSSVQTQLNGKQSALGYTPEDVSNKSTNASLGTSDTAYPSQKAVKSYVDNGLGTKQATITGAASSITGNNLTANRVLVSSSTGKVAVSAVTATELSYLDGVTSSVQTQLNGKQAAGDYVTRDGTQTITGNKTFGGNLISSLNVEATEDVHVVLANVNLKSQGILFSGAANRPAAGNIRYSKAGNFIFASADTDTMDLYVMTRYSGAGAFTPWRKLWHNGNLINPVTGTGTAGRMAVWNGTGSVSNVNLLASGETLETSSGPLILQPQGNISTGINLTGSVNVYSSFGTGVVRNTAKTGHLRLSGGDETSDGANIGLYGSDAGNHLQLRIGNLEAARISSDRNLLVGTSVNLSGGGRVQVDGQVNCDDPTADRHAATRGWIRAGVESDVVYSEEITVTLGALGSDVAVKTFALEDKLLLIATAIPVNDINASSHATVAKRYDGSLSVVSPFSTHSTGILFTGGTNRTLSVQANSASMVNEAIKIKLLYLNR